MELCYRGVRYQSNPTPVKIAGKKNVLRFRGCTYELNHAAIEIQKSSNPEVVYRGVSVASGQQLTFLGSSCEHKKVVLVPTLA